jgi:serine/threonine protein kinase
VPNEGASAGPTSEQSVQNLSGSTDSHHPASDPISELFRKTGSSRRSANSDILQILANPGSNPANPPTLPVPGLNVNTDDAPTIITKNQSPGSTPAPIPLMASNEQQGIANRRLGHFELIEAIGAGGMAAVLKARDLELGRIVALKILPPEAAKDPESITRFKQEARAAAMLDHENVARVYFCGEDQSLHFIAFEFVEGVTLRVLIDRRGTISAADCIRYMIQVAAGLNHAAERGVVHRDIKPSNIIITPDGRAKIVDMGLARHLDSLSVNGGVTQSGITLGTFDYISPEQALDPRRADVRSDIYSLGCTFYHALTGRPPVPEGTAAKKLQAHQHVDPLDPRILNPSIPDGLAAVLSGMMAKNPDQRFQTPTDLIAHLKGLMEQLKLGSDVIPSDSVVQGVPASQSGFKQAPKLHLNWLLAASAVAAAIAAFAMSTGNPASQRSLPPWISDSGNQKDAFPAAPQTAGTQNTGLIGDEGAVTVHTVKELADVLSKSASKVQIRLAPGKYDFKEFKDGLVLQGKEIELIGSTDTKGSATTEIDLTASPNGNLTIKAESLAIREIRFVIHPGSLVNDSAEAASLPIALAIKSSNLVTLEDCSFFAPQTQSEEEAIAVSITSGSTPPKVNIFRCAFAQTDIAVQVPARSEVTVADSGFASRKSAIQVYGGKTEEIEAAPSAPTTLELSRSTFILEPRSTAVDTGNSTDTTNVAASYCVFTAVGKAQDQPATNPFGTIVTVAKVKQDGKPTFSFHGGHKNAYYRVNPVAISSAETTLTFEECKTNELDVKDKEAVFLARRPIKPNPFDAFEKEPWSAFGLDIKNEPALFVNEDPTVIGVQFHNPIMHNRRAYPSSTVLLWPPAKPGSNEPTQKVWYPVPQKGENIPPGTDTDLVKLLRDARPDEVILIKHDGLLDGLYHMAEAIELKPRTGSTDFRVTFRPFPGCKPILTTPLAPKPGENIPLSLEQSLFRLMSGEVTFEGIQFLLKPSASRNPFKVSAVSIVGGKGCTFNDCVFTLAEEDDQIATVVKVADPEKNMMAMAEGTSRPVPEIKLNHCLIRGKGRGVWIEVSRAVKVDLTQSLTAIDGPLILTEPAGKSVAGARSSLTLNHVTAFVGGPVMEMRGGKVGEMRTSGLVTFEVHADRCLFAGVPGAGKSIVELDGIDPGDVKSILEWRVQNSNRYANFEEGTSPLIVRPGDGATPKEWDWNRWNETVGEPATTQSVVKLMFTLPPGSLKELAALKRRDIVFPDTMEVKFDEVGVNWKLLPDPVR